MTEREQLHISAFDAADLDREIQGLAELLHASVQTGASVGFVLPFSIAEAEAFWRETVRPGVEAGGVLLLVARQEGRVVGTVQLGHDTPANQPHRADVKKLMVHPDCRRQGVARALMAELEAHARRLGRSLLTLDTRTGDAAEPLYTSMGYQTVGMIPDFCLETVAKDRLDPTTIMYKALGPHHRA